ncbi:hypothetical protein [Brevundimonas sp.]|uniref:hypothetical protein n=1 Tax=Brevundimonas sp. TaxID=1871086 RepID=UPI002737C7BE|nr:hypothetical protein [Brevundimonas sp.]MDP3802139.1 hypothetical protein [Brevundimonas sp.]
MKPSLLVLMVAGCATFAGPSLAQTQVDLLRELCLVTEMRREPFDRLAAERGGERLLRIVRAGEPQDSQTWETMYGMKATGMQFWMSGETGGTDSSHATSCGVAATEPDVDWRSALEALALELEMSPAPAVERPNSLEARAWSTDSSARLSLSYDLYRSGLTVRFTRPSTISAQ